MENIAKEATEARVIGVKITYISNYRCPITKSSNRTAVIGHPRDRATITRQIGARRTNHDREFCYRLRYDLCIYHDRGHINLTIHSDGSHFAVKQAHGIFC